MTGHTNLVMCAQFHPSKELIVSCSLDQTVRLWDYSNLVKKYTSSGSSKPSEGSYSGTEVELKAIMEGHDRGINWCDFHPTQNLILSAADDRKVKLWKYNGKNIMSYVIIILKRKHRKSMGTRLIIWSFK